VLSQSIEQLRNPSTHLEEEEEEGSSSEHRVPEITSPPAGVIRSRSEPAAAHARVIRMKTEPEDRDREEERGG
ncbi:hypothetical protein M9458_038974, partial [Cirrhinus mrigala]